MSHVQPLVSKVARHRKANEQPTAFSKHSDTAYHYFTSSLGTSGSKLRRVLPSVFHVSLWHLTPAFISNALAVGKVKMEKTVQNSWQESFASSQ